MKQRITKTVLSILTALCLLVSSLGLAQAQTLTGNAIVKQGVTVSNNTYTFDPVGGTATYTTPSKAWEIKSVSTNATWITATKKSSRSITITVPKNENASGRSGKVTVVCNKGTQTLTVKQTGNTLTVSAIQSPVSGGKNSFTFTAVAAVGTVTVSSPTQWLTASKKGNTITVNCSPNEGGPARTGIIYVSVGSIKKTITFIQQSGRKSIDFSTYRDIIKADKWTPSRKQQLNDFYDHLIIGARNRGETNTVAILQRAKKISTFTWTCKKGFNGYKNKWAFIQGQEYVGTPYQQTHKYLMYEESSKLSNDPDQRIKNFQKATEDPDNAFYQNTSTNGPGYGTDCSGFVSYCLNLPEKKDTTALYKKYTNRYKSGNDKKAHLSSGDILYIEYTNEDARHVLLVASVLKENGVIKAIAVLESQNRTTASGRNLHVFYDDDASLMKLFGNASYTKCEVILKNVLCVEERSTNNCGTVADFFTTYSSHYLLDANGKN